MRKQIIDVLRMAGQKISAFDEAYADRVADLIRSHAPESTKGPLMMTSTAPLFNTTLDLEGAVGREALLGRALQAGTIASSAGVRYIAPGALTAAGLIGLQQGIDSLYDTASQVPVMGNNPQ